MKIIKLTLLLITIAVLKHSAFSQNYIRYSPCINCTQNIADDELYEYGAISNAQIRHVVSDYGRRECCKNKWHKGIDVSPGGGDADLGYKLYPIEDGTIRKIRGGNFKYVIIEGAHIYGYGHIFKATADDATSRLGNFVFKTITYLNENYNVIIDLETLSETNIANRKAYCAVEGISFKYGDVDLITINSVSQDEPFAPLGNSLGADPEIDAHLHLHQFRNLDNIANPITSSNCFDPTWTTKYENHINQSLDDDEPDYNLEIIEVDWKWNNQEPSSVLVRPIMTRNGTPYPAGLNYNHGIMNTDEVELLFRPTGSRQNWDYFNGGFIESRISLGGNLANGQIYPGVYNGEVNNRLNNNCLSCHGSKNRTGIFGHAYRGSVSGFPYDDYFFSDIYPRIHKDDALGTPITYAPINELARYPDGYYELTARSRTVDGTIDYSDIQTESFDNFLPYIKEVFVKEDNENGELVYHGYWDWNGTSLELIREGTSELDEGSDLWIQVELSESGEISEVLLEDEESDFSLVSRSDASNTYEFIVSPTDFFSLSEGNLTLVFDGVDSHGNKLITNPEALPHRTGENTWSATPNFGKDMHHTIRVGDFNCSDEGLRFLAGGAQNNPTVGASANTCLYAGFRVDKTEIVAGDAVYATPVISAPVGATYEWDFGSVNANPVRLSQDHAHGATVIYERAGTYTITLTIAQGTSVNTAEQQIKVVSAEQARKNLEIVSISPDESSVSINSPVQFEVRVSSMSTAQLKYYWDFGDGGQEVDLSDPQRPIAEWGYGGTKDVTVKVVDIQNNITKTRVFSKAIEVDPERGIQVDFSCPGKLQQNQKEIKISPRVTGAVSDDVEYRWDFGDGTVLTEIFPKINDQISYEYSAHGSYNITLTVRDLVTNKRDRYFGTENTIDQTKSCVIVPVDRSCTITNFELNGQKFGLPQNNPPDCSDGLIEQDITVPANVPVPFSNITIPNFNNDPTSSYLIFNYTVLQIRSTMYKSLTGSFSTDGVSSLLPTNLPFLKVFGEDSRHFSPDPARKFIFLPSNSGPANHDQIQLEPCSAPCTDELRDFRKPGDFLGRPNPTIIVKTNGFTTQEIAQIRESCEAGFKELRFSETCLSDNNEHLEVQLTNVKCFPKAINIYRNDRLVHRHTDFEMGVSFPDRYEFALTDLGVNINQGTFPREEKFRVELIHTSDEIMATTGDNRVTFSRVPTANAGTDRDVCTGARTVLGVEPEDNTTYKWKVISATADDGSAIPSSEATSFFDDLQMVNPTFTALKEGTYVLEVEETNVNTGCSATDQVEVQTGDIRAQGFATTVSLNRTQELGVSVIGGGQEYNYEWTPRDYLDNPFSPTPTFTPPSHPNGGTIEYNVHISFRNECETNVTGVVTHKNFPPSQLEVGSGRDGAGMLDLTWVDNSIESSFVVERSERSDGGFKEVRSVGPDSTETSDYYCLDASKVYYYRVKSIDAFGRNVGYSNIASGRIPYFLDAKWEATVPEGSGQVTNQVNVIRRNQTPVMHIASDGQLTVLTQTTGRNAREHNMKLYQVDPEGTLIR